MRERNFGIVDRVKIAGAVLNEQRVTVARAKGNDPTQSTGDIVKSWGNFVEALTRGDSAKLIVKEPGTGMEYINGTVSGWEVLKNLNGQPV